MKNKFIQKNEEFNENDCPDSNLLAAFVDGNITWDERKKLLSHLRQCKTCYQIVADAVILSRDLAPLIPEPEIEFDETEFVKKSQSASQKSFFAKLNKWKVAAYTAPIAAALFVVFIFNDYNTWQPDELLSSLSDQKELAHISKNLPFPNESTATLGFNQGISDKKAFFRLGTLVSQIEIGQKAGIDNMVAKYGDHLADLIQMSGSTATIVTEKDLDSVTQSYLKSPLSFYFKLGMLIEMEKAYSLVGKSQQFDKTYFYALQEDKNFQSLPPGVIRRFKEIDDLLYKNTIAKNDQIVYKLLQEIQQILY